MAKRNVKRAACAMLLVLLSACQAPLPDHAQGRGLDGRLLIASPLSPEVQAEREAKLLAACEAATQHPEDVQAAIWVGRQLGYLNRYREAIDAYSEALQRWPDNAFVLRHRGHRWLTVREFARAVDDLQRAADACRTTLDQTEPDGLPVRGRPPHSSLHYNVHYHLGLAQFVCAEWAAAERAWLDCLACCDNDESRVAVTHWLWCVRMRRGNPAGAAACVQGIREDLDVVENTSYLQLCLLYAGKRARSDLAPAAASSSGAALRFGLAHHQLVTGDRQRAKAEFAALAADAGWSAFGVIAAEAELRRW